MKDLRVHWEELAARLAEARRLCLLTDFDGTLSAIVERPERAELGEEARRALEALAGNPRVTLGVLSGRSLADLEARIPLPGIWLVGNHGYELRLPNGEFRRFYDAADLRQLAQVGDELEEETRSIPGVIVERKGPIVAVHYRRVEEELHGTVMKGFLAVVNRHRRQVMIARGSRVLEAQVRGGRNKGTAVRFIRQELPRDTLTLYFGDDMTDRDAFRALQNVGISVAVGTETDLADYFLEGPPAVIGILARIAGEFRKPETGRRRGRK